MSGFSSLISHRNGPISLLRLSFSKFGCFSRVGFSCGAVKHSKRDDSASHQACGVSGEFLFFIWLLHILIAFPELFYSNSSCACIGYGMILIRGLKIQVLEP